MLEDKSLHPACFDLRCRDVDTEEGTTPKFKTTQRPMGWGLILGVSLSKIGSEMRLFTK